MVSKRITEVYNISWMVTHKIETIANQIATMVTIFAFNSKFVNAIISTQTLSKAKVIQIKVSTISKSSSHIYLNLFKCNITLNKRLIQQI